MDINLIIILIFAIFYFGFIIYTRRKGDFEEFAVAGRGLGVFLIFASMSASYIGPAFTMGLARDGFENGMYLALVASVSGLSLIFVARFMVPIIKAKFIDSYSIGDIVGGQYSHNHWSIKMIVGLITFIFFAGISIAMAYAGGELINYVFGYSRTVSIIIITGIVTLYSFFGGIRATIQTDAFQFINFLLLIPALGILLLFHDSFDISSFVDQVGQRTGDAFEGKSLVALISILIFWFFSSGFDGAVYNRVLASKDRSTAFKAMLYSGLFIMAWVVMMVFIGCAGQFLYPDMVNDDQLLLKIARLHFNPIFYGLFIVAMIGVVMSSMDSALNGAAIVLSEDMAGSWNKDLTDEQKLLISRMGTIGLGLLAIIVAGYLSSVLKAVIMVFSFYIPVLVPSILFGVFKSNPDWRSAMTSMVTGFVTYLIFLISGNGDIPYVSLSFLLAVIAYLIADRFFTAKVALN